MKHYSIRGLQHHHRSSAAAAPPSGHPWIILILDSISDKKKTKVLDFIIFSKMLGYHVNSLNFNHQFSLMVKSSDSGVRMT